MRRKIEASAKLRAEIAQVFGVTIVSVGQALNFRRNSQQSEKIRQMALAKGAKLLRIEEIIPSQTVKVLDSKGNVERIITINK